MPKLVFTKGELRDSIQTSPGMATAVLLALYDRQTEEEQCIGGTVYANGAGFNGADGPILSDFAQFYLRQGFLTEKQLSYVRRACPKYLGQLEGVALAPKAFKTFEPVKKFEFKGRPIPDEVKTNGGKLVTIVDNVMNIRFPYDGETVAQVKTLSGRSWNASEYVWTAPVCLDNMLAVKSWGFAVTGDLTGLPAVVREGGERLLAASQVSRPAPRAPLLKTIPGLKRELYPYQMEGVSFIEWKKGRALVADEMGLGKTPQSLAWLQLHPEHRPAIIVCPASLKLNWQREAESWTTCGHEVQVIDGRYSADNPITGKILIINYDILPNKCLYACGSFTWLDTQIYEKVVTRDNKGKYIEIPYTGWVDYLVDFEPKVVITDEAQYYKNSDAARTTAVKALAQAAPHFIALSGTPLENRPIELFNVINFVNPNIFPHYFHYAKRYCGAVNNGFGWDFGGASNILELNSKLKETIMLRRKKCDVLKDLPEKVKTVVPIEITNRAEYNRAVLDFIAWVNERFGAEKAESARQTEALVRIETMKQLAVKGKLTACIAWIRDFLDSGEKLVVSTTHTNVLDSIMKEFGKLAVRIDGGVTGPNRQKAVDAFQGDDAIRLIVGNLTAIGVGLTLTAASNTCTIELGWKPALHTQFEDRVHRIGQTSDSVNAWYLIAANTIEEEIALLIDEKLKVVTAVLDGEDVASSSLLVDLLSNYKKR